MPGSGNRGGGASARKAPKSGAGGLQPPDGIETVVLDKGRLRFYSADVNGNDVTMAFSQKGPNEAEISFTINGDLRIGSIPEGDRTRAAIKLLRMAQYDATTRPEGFQYFASAFGGDSAASRRAGAYSRLLTRPVGGLAGGTQYGVVRNGRIVPDEARLKAEERRFRITDSTANNNLQQVRQQRQRQRELERLRRQRQQEP